MQTTKVNIATDSTQLEPSKPMTKCELIAIHLLEQGAQGISALSGLAGLHDLNVRNSISQLRRQHGIIIEDAFFEHSHNGGGTTQFKRYWLADQEQAHKLVVLINHWRHQRQTPPLTDDYAAILCARAVITNPLPPAA
jgi:hypothetical protein